MGSDRIVCRCRLGRQRWPVAGGVDAAAAVRRVVSADVGLEVRRWVLVETFHDAFERYQDAVRDVMDLKDEVRCRFEEAGLPVPDDDELSEIVLRRKNDD